MAYGSSRRFMSDKFNCIWPDFSKNSPKSFRWGWRGLTADTPREIRCSMIGPVLPSEWYTTGFPASRAARIGMSLAW